MPYDYKLTTTIPASAQEIYEAWLDSLAHTEMTGAEAIQSDALGAEVAAWDGYISGRNLELVPGERIVQSWRTSEFTDAHEDSIITVTLTETVDGTTLTLLHVNVPAEQTSYEEGGWQQHYFEPMQEYFAKRNQAAGEEAAPKKASKKAKARAEAPKTAPKTKTKRAAASKAKSAKSKTKAKAKAKAKAKTKSKAKAKPAAKKAKGKSKRKGRR
jgi:uncharacterized protein YndB with AHSA1/START domain